VLGPVPTVKLALRLIEGEQHIDAAVLDINLRGERVYPVLDTLLARGVPVTFATGYADEAIPPGYSQIPRCQKPVTAAAVAERLFG
jgi:hypothetical protein